MKLGIILVEGIYDYVCYNIISGLKKIGKHDVKIYCPEMKENGNNIPNEWIEKDKNNFFHFCKGAKWILCFETKFGNDPYSNTGTLKILDEMNIYEKCVYIDWIEYNWNNKCRRVEKGQRAKFEPWLFYYMVDKCKFYFKRETYPEDMWNYGIIPFNFGFPTGRHNKGLNSIDEIKREKNIDIFCSMPQLVTGLRFECDLIVNEMGKQGMYKVETRKNFEISEYYKKISDSYISIDAFGAGNCNGRSYEIVPYGSVMFRQKWDIICPYDFVKNGKKDEEMIVEFSSPEEFIHKIREYLGDKDHLYEMSKKAYNHLMKYHTDVARAQYILDIVEGVKDVRDCLNPDDLYRLYN